ncbi:hypothetical protein A2U01_0086355, partial [Trifolium medium]|nr:hypothetical protein [Trifolium medium]
MAIVHRRGVVPAGIPMLKSEQSTRYSLS